MSPKYVIFALAFTAPHCVWAAQPGTYGKMPTISEAQFYDEIAGRFAMRDRSRDGQIEAYELTGRFIGSGTSFTQAQARDFIAAFDLDGSQSVTLDEMLYSISSAGIFDRLDTNDNGYLTSTETRSIRALKREAPDPYMPGYTPDPQ